MNKWLKSILLAVSLGLVLAGNACSKPAITTTVSGSGTISVASGGFQPSTMMARVGITITFNNMMGGQATLIGKSGFMTGVFGGMPMMMGGNYQYTFTTPGTYVVGLSGQTYQCTITVVS